MAGTYGGRMVWYGMVWYGGRMYHTILVATAFIEKKEKK